ncbi:MAG: TolC family protein [Bacteroidales bacterium]|jgi:outer membrane protein TolC|nr:TolC family protein [Bacteroidales bacterium]
MNRYILIPFLILAIYCFDVKGQVTTRRLTLEEAVGISEQQSPGALNAKQNFRASYWDYRSYRASNLPALGVTATLPSIQQSLSPYLNPDGTQSYVRQQNISANANLALTQKLGITGGTVYLSSGLSGVNNFNAENPISYMSTPVNIGLSQPLFTYNPYRWDRKIQPLKYDQAKRKYIEDIEQIAITTTDYFFALLQAQIEKKISLTNLSNYDTLYRIAKGRYQLGKIAENDLLQLELNFLKAQAAVENANLALDNAQFQFKSFLRIKDSVNILLVPPANIDFFKIDPLNAVDLANKNSSTILDFKKRLLEAARDVNRAKTEGRFDAELDAVIGLTQSGATVPDAYINPLDQRQVSLGLTIPIVDWGVSRGKIKMAQSQEEVVKTSVEQDIIDFQRNVYLKVVQFNMQQNQLRIAAKSDTVARKSYEVTKGRYLIGKINSILDLNNAQIETDNSEKNYYSALQTFWKSYYEIRKMTLFDFINNEPLRFDISSVK